MKKLINIFKKHETSTQFEQNLSSNVIHDNEDFSTFREGLKEEKQPISPIQKDVKRKTPIFSPTSFSTIKPIADELITYKIVLVDFSKLSHADKVRSIDFITGVMYGLDGEYNKVENKIYKFITKK
ncbi:cell division protein SepF [Williamsoniiplasma luminosum]|uniref:Cell division protein SepF n=1 Tax=Williamsoniiplasma luminosum TaxID=214888 RepID=A0A2S0NJ45_9MOLU|nr:cell division protein SepF [Williamsoniiplasma luminosum]AVP49022.1 MAG: hypothetical protein C5T88_00255 [Williamsoniiplasma luminosum]